MPSRRNWPSPTVPSAFGRRWNGYGPPARSNAAGCTRRSTFGTNCRRSSSPRPKSAGMRSGRPRPKGGQRSGRLLPRSVRSQARQGLHLPEEGSDLAAHLLQLLRRTLAKSSDHQPNQVRFRHDPPPRSSDQRIRQSAHRSRHDVQVRPRMRKRLASPQWL